MQSELLDLTDGGADEDVFEQDFEESDEDMITYPKAAATALLMKNIGADPLKVDNFI